MWPWVIKKLLKTGEKNSSKTDSVHFLWKGKYFDSDSVIVLQFVFDDLQYFLISLPRV